ncbi:hypothetical protein [Kitasatospora sp. HPMI-4]|uniref:hypothetical protein n=1 Tax=Kitasatospora sp. HPMI-4 TaxID=3448443 RepID=UPI003F1C3928
MDDETGMVLVRSSFPVTGQPIRVVMINGEPWFVTADVCKVLGAWKPEPSQQAGRPAAHPIREQPPDYSHSE